MSDSMLDIRELRVEHVVRHGIMQAIQGRVKALDGVNLSLKPGEVVGVAGESGSGKTTLARVIVGLQKATSGEVRLFGQPLPETEHWPVSLRRRVQMVFQDASGFLDPRQRVISGVVESLRGLTDIPASEQLTEARHLFSRVGISSELAQRFPHELSGGQRQRVAIAKALAASPDLIVLDEPTSALDVSVQAQILNLLQELRQERNVGYVLISHDLNVIAHLCDRVAVMYLGRIVEEGPVDALFSNPQHPYTKALLSAVPDADPTKPWQPIALKGEAASGMSPPGGCTFHPRCPWAQPVCVSDSPVLQSVGDLRTACHFIGELSETPPEGEVHTTS